jgi:hypothetical protein
MSLILSLSREGISSEIDVHDLIQQRGRVRRGRRRGRGHDGTATGTSPSGSARITVGVFLAAREAFALARARRRATGEQSARSIACPHRASKSRYHRIIR